MFKRILLASVLTLELFVRIQQFDPVNAAIRSDINVQFIADVNRFNASGRLLKAKVSDVVARVVGQFHFVSLRFKNTLP